MRRAVLLSAIFEAATGIALIATPSLVGLLLLGTELSGAAVVVARVAGLALLALAVACWPRRMLPRQQRVALLGYNLLVALYLTYVGLQGQWHGVLLWPAAGLHALFTGLILSGLAGGREPIGPS